MKKNILIIIDVFRMVFAICFGAFMGIFVISDGIMALRISICSAVLWLLLIYLDYWLKKKAMEKSIRKSYKEAPHDETTDDTAGKP